jgi:hypothetical protein
VGPTCRRGSLRFSPAKQSVGVKSRATWVALDTRSHFPTVTRYKLSLPLPPYRAVCRRLGTFESVAESHQEQLIHPSRFKEHTVSSEQRTISNRIPTPAYSLCYLTSSVPSRSAKRHNPPLHPTHPTRQKKTAQKKRQGTQFCPTCLSLLPKLTFSSR